MFIRNATETFLDAVEFVDLCKSCMQYAHIALSGVQLACGTVDVVVHLREAVVLWQDVRLLLETVINLAELLISLFILVALVAIFSMLIIQIECIILDNCLRALRL